MVEYIGVSTTARSTEKELARQVSYLKAENQILRSRLPGRISLTEREKNRLVRFAKTRYRIGHTQYCQKHTQTKWIRDWGTTWTGNMG
ncbi:hypothetical protein SH449x_004885 [Pirellulaceae bacterium SH449]